MVVKEWGEEYIWGFDEKRNKPGIIRIDEEEKEVSIIEVFKNSAIYRKLDAKKVGPPKRRKRDSYEHVHLLSTPPNCVGHHITDKYVVPVPKEPHNTGPIFQTNLHRELVEQWMKENNRVLYGITQFIKETEL